jgi:YqaJ-like viral recombinase domain
MAKAATIKKPPKSLLVIHDCEQGTDEWKMLRLGLPTASNFATIMASGRDGGLSVTRTKLLHRLAGEIICGEPAEESFRNAAMDRGNALEDEARQAYCRRKNADVRRVGFVRNFDGLKACGASPDGILGFDGGLEIKTAKADVLIPMLQRPAAMPPEHRAQIQANLWICERDWWDLTIYCHRLMPALDVKIYRDEAFIKEMSGQVERFNWELKKLVNQLQSMGTA